MREISQSTVPHLFNTFLSKMLETAYDHYYFTYKLIALSFLMLRSAEAMDPCYVFSID